MLDSEVTTALFLEAEARRQKRRADALSVLASDQVLEDYASKLLLNAGEAVAIIQGFTPPIWEYGDERIFYLDDHAESVHRLLNDGSRGKLPLPCRPQELVEWSATAGVDLPIAFVRAVRAKLVPTAATDLPCVTPNLIRRATRPGGRLDAGGYDSVLQAQAREIAASYRERKGRWPTKAEVGRELSKRNGKSISVRRYCNDWNPGCVFR